MKIPLKKKQDYMQELWNSTKSLQPIISERSFVPLIKWKKKFPENTGKSA